MEETTILTQASNTEQGFVTQKLLMEQLGYAHTYIQKGHKANQLFFLDGLILGLVRRLIR